MPTYRHPGTVITDHRFQVPLDHADPTGERIEVLARRTDWPDLYDPEQLARNEVPVAAAIYHDDLYVDTDDSLATARAVRGLRPWITNEYEHDGLRVSEGRVLDRLIRLFRGEM
ncbi:hypothetical protein [Micromonospora sp. NPDC049301]|uniref:hypothetical protein n=1 Tax=Micromonospora sp. NPDC049301 TaxID=3155723 RepID=UPI003447CD7D